MGGVSATGASGAGKVAAPPPARPGEVRLACPWWWCVWFRGALPALHQHPHRVPPWFRHHVVLTASATKRIMDLAKRAAESGARDLMPPPDLLEAAVRHAMSFERSGELDRTGSPKRAIVTDEEVGAEIRRIVGRGEEIPDEQPAFERFWLVLAVRERTADREWRRFALEWDGEPLLRSLVNDPPTIPPTLRRRYRVMVERLAEAASATGATIYGRPYSIRVIQAPSEEEAIRLARTGARSITPIERGPRFAT